MSKSPFDLNAMAKQQKSIEVSKAVGQVVIESTQAITQINQQAAQELASLFQKKVAALLKTQDPKAAFDDVHAEVLQDAAKEVSEYQAKLMGVLSGGNKELQPTNLIVLVMNMTLPLGRESAKAPTKAARST